MNTGSINTAASSTAASYCQDDTCSCHQDRLVAGSELCPSLHGNWDAPIYSPHSRSPLYFSKVNTRSENPDMNTPNSSPISPRTVLFPKSYEPWVPGTMSPPGHPQQTSTYGKMRALSLVLGSVTVVDLIGGTIQRTGMPFGYMQCWEMLAQSPHQYEFKVTGLSSKSLQTTWLHPLWYEFVMSTGASLAQESREELGMLPVGTLILKIQDPSFGAVTETKRLLSSMNFEEELTSGMYCDGSIAIQSLWKSKAVQCHSSPPPSTSHPISTQESGIQTSTEQRSRLYSDVFK